MSPNFPLSEDYVKEIILGAVKGNKLYGVE